MKRILGVPSYTSNHEVAESCEQLLPKHHVALIQARYYHRMTKSNNIIINSNRQYLQSGLFINSVENLFHNTYNIDVWKYDVNTIYSRILWVQRHEERRAPVSYDPNTT